MSQPPLKLTPREYTLQEAFGKEFPTNFKIQGYEPCDCPFVPKRQTVWAWDREVLRDLIVWHQTGEISDGLYLFGHTGVGKSGSLKQFCAALNIPLYERTMYQGLEFEDLVSRVDLAGGTTIPSFSTLALAMGAEGYPGIFCANEFNRAEPGMAVGLYEVLDGRPIQVHMGGLTVVEPRKGFRIAGTGNGTMASDVTGLYVGTRRQDLALQDRFMSVEVKYLPPELEEPLVALVAPPLDARLRASMVEVANEIRAAFMGEKDDAGALPITMSTRVLLRWARFTWAFRQAENHQQSPIRYALQRVLLNAARGTPHVEMALDKLIEGKLGEPFRGVP